MQTNHATAKQLCQWLKWLPAGVLAGLLALTFGCAEEPVWEEPIQPADHEWEEPAEPEEDIEPADEEPVFDLE